MPTSKSGLKRVLRAIVREKTKLKRADVETLAGEIAREEGRAQRRDPGKRQGSREARKPSATQAV